MSKKREPKYNILGEEIPVVSLPHNTIKSREVRVDKFPKGKRVGKRTMVVDRCHTMGGLAPYSITLAYVSDHPFLKALEACGAPRNVKSLYRKEVRLRHLMATDCGPYLEEWDRAERSWRNWLLNDANADAIIKQVAA